MASHVSPALTTPFGLHVGLLSAPHAPSPRDTLHLSAGVYKSDHSSAAEASAMYYYHHHHRAAYLSGSEPPKNQQIKESSSINSVYGNNRSSFMIDDILSKSRKISEESPEKVVKERRDSKDQRLLDHIVIDKDRYVIERRSGEDGVVHAHRDRYPSGYSSNDRYEVVAVRRRSPSPTSDVGSSLHSSERAGLVARVSSTSGSPASTMGRPVSPTVVVRKRSRSPPSSSPRSPSHYDHHLSGDRHLSGSHYEHRDHHQHRHPDHHLHNGTSEHYGHSSPRHHHTVHHQHNHHHQQQHHQSRLLQTDTRDVSRGHGGSGEVGCRSRSVSPPSGGGSPRALSLHLPARPRPIHPTAVHASSSALASTPTVQDIYGSLPRSTGAEHAGALTVPAPVSLPGIPPPPPPPSVTHHGAAPTAALSMMYDPLAAATLASPYLQSPLGAYPAPPAVYSLPPYTRPEHYAFLARHHPCKYKLRISQCIKVLAQSKFLEIDRRSHPVQLL